MKLTAWEQFPISVRKAWMVMRLSSFFILFFCLHLSARTTAQRVTLSSTGISMEQFLSQLEKQTPYSFLMKDGLVSTNQKIDIHVSDSPLESVLDEVLKPLGLTYRIDYKAVYILKETKAHPLGGGDSLSSPPPIDIHGRVTDSLGNPLVGASILVKGTKLGTTTDGNGNFVLTGIKENSTLLVSYTGYGTKSYRIKGSEVIAISLNKSVSPLDEIRIIAYGSTTERYSTGDVTTVKSTDIEKQPVANPLLALEGRVPGMQITQTTGTPGGAVAVQIRGKNSILNGTDPLYVIDGIPYTSQLLPNLNFNWGYSGTGGTTTALGNGSPLNYINPSDIERIDVLKDADATAIYGSRAANGAILITTKKGKAGKTRIEANFQEGLGHVTRTPDLLNRRQYLDMRYEALNNDSLTPNPAKDFDLTLWDSTRQTDWQKTLIGGNSHYTDAEASLSGGNGNTQFLVGAGFHRETSVFLGSFPDTRGSLHFSLNNNSDNDRFKFQLSASYAADDNNTPPASLTYYAAVTPPDAPPLYKQDGTLNWAPDPASGFASWQNPAALLNRTFNSKTNNLIGQSMISYQIVPGLDIKSSFGYTNMQVNEISANPATEFDPAYLPLIGNGLRSAQYANNSIRSWIVEPQASYSGKIAKGKLNALLGATFQQNNNDGESQNGSGYASDLLLQDIASAESITVSSIHSQYKYNAFFGRLNYNWDDKYVVTLSGRRDGSSRFGPANQFHNFGSAAAAWVFSNTDFVKNHIGFLSFGKLRGSYGTTGNDQIGDYQFMELYSSASYGNPYQSSNTLGSNGLSNPYLQWEETKKAEIAVELGFLKDRIFVSAVYYQNRSSNDLLYYSLPSITGFTSITKNFPATFQNSGAEFVLNSINVKSVNFNWSTSFNITIPRNKLVSFPDLANSPYSQAFIIGQPITVARLYHAQVDPATGIYKFEDTKGNYNFQPTSGVDNFVNINTSPKYYGGFLNTFSYKGLQLDVMFQFVKQIGQNYLFSSLPGAYLVNQPVDVLARWQKPGDLATIQRFVGSPGANIDGNGYYAAQSTASSQSDIAYSDASFIRLKNVSLSWTIPKTILTKISAEHVRLFIQGQNLLTITNYKGSDPETQNGQILPPLRVWTAGVQVSL